MPRLIEPHRHMILPFALRGEQCWRWSRSVSFQEEKPLNSPARGTPPQVGRLLRPGLAVSRPIGLLVVLVALVGGAPLSTFAQPERPRLVSTFTNGDKDIGPVRFSPDCKTLAIAAGDGLVLWEVIAQQVRVRLEIPGALVPLGTIAFAPNGRDLITGGETSRPRLWNLLTGKPKVLPVQADGIKEWTGAMALSPDGKTLAVGDARGIVRLWDVATGKESATLRGKEVILDLAFSPNGKTLAAITVTERGPPVGRMWVWDVAGRRLRTTFELEITPGCLAFSPDSQTLAVSQGGSVQLRDPATGRLQASWETGPSSPSALAFSPDGRVLVAAGGDVTLEGFIQGLGEVKFWDVTSKKEMLALRAHEERVGSMALSPDGRLLAVSCGQSSLINLWDVSAITGRAAGQWPPVAPARARPDPVDQGLAPAGKLTPDEFEKLWSDLAGKDAPQAYRALWALVAAPQQTVAFLARKLQPAPPADLTWANRLIADLESEQFAVRQKAILELEKAGAKAEPALRQVLQGKPRPETRAQVEKLLEKLAGPVTDPEELRTLRSIEVLEHIGSAEAWQVLETLATGAPQARVTREAILALERLSKRFALTP